MKKFQLSISAVPARDLRPAKNNSRKHSDAQIDQIVRSIREFGWTKPILVDGDEIVAGHGAREAALRIYKAGGTIRMAGSWEELPAGAVPVIDCAGWSEDQRRAYVIADNKIAENSEWDESLLKAELLFLEDEGFDLGLTGFDGAALERVLLGGSRSGRTDPDAIPPEPVIPVSRPGDIWLLGAYFECEACGKKFSYADGMAMGGECSCDRE